MSNRITNLCRPLRMSSTQKAVLMCIADHADADGKAWPSIPGICEWTCLSRTAVIEAMKWLEAQGWMTIEKVVGRNNRCTVNVPGPDETPSEPVRQPDPHPSASRTGQIAEPVRQPDPPGTPDAPPPVRQPDPTRPAGVPEPSINHQSTTNEAPEKTRASAPAVPGICKPDDVDAQIWTDWQQLRRTKKAPVTATVLSHARQEADKAGLTLDRFLAVWCARGSQGLEASWLKPNERSQVTGEPAWRREQRERMQAIVPSIAAKPPGARREVIDMETGRPVRMDRHRGFEDRDYESSPDGSIPP